MNTKTNSKNSTNSTNSKNLKNALKMNKTINDTMIIKKAKVKRTKINIGELDEIEELEALEELENTNKKVVKQSKNKLTSNLKVEHIKAITYDFILLVGCHKKHPGTYSFKDFKADKDKENYNNIIKGLNIDKLIKYLDKNNIYNVDNVIYNPLHYKYKFGKYPDEIENLLDKRQPTIKEIELIKRFKSKELKKQLLKILFNKNKNKADIIYNCLDLKPVYNDFMIYTDDDFNNKFFLNQEQEFKYKTDNEIKRYNEFLEGEEITERKITKTKKNNMIFKEMEECGNNNNTCSFCFDEEQELILNYKNCKCALYPCLDCYSKYIKKDINKCPGMCGNTKINKNLINPYECGGNKEDEEFNLKLTYNDKGDINFIWMDEKGEYKNTAIQKIDFDLKEILIELWYEVGFNYEYITNHLYNVNNRIKGILNDANLSMLSEGGGGEVINRVFNVYNKNNNKKKYELYKELIEELIDFKSLIGSLIVDEEDFINDRVLGMLDIEEGEEEDTNIYFDYENEIIYYSNKEEGDILDLFDNCDFEAIINNIF